MTTENSRVLLRAPGRQASSVLTLLALAGLLTVSVWWPASVRGAQTDVFFSEPYTGNKVRHYDVELPVARGTTREFSVPGDCGEAMETLHRGAEQWADRIEKGVWQKVGNDCAFYAFLHRYPSGQLKDYITDYDFRNTDIADLLVSLKCEPNPRPAGSGGCRFVSLPMPDIRPMLSFAAEGDDRSAFDAATCRINRGVFRGHVLVDDMGLKCRFDRRAPGIRVMSVDYADVNGDGWLDAVLRFVPVGPGTSRRPMVVAYTRKGPDMPLVLATEDGQPAGGAALQQ